ncbi:MAG TPA: zinc ABC transporter substrate-binding protein [Solirubrobacteraceae bacterium]
MRQLPHWRVGSPPMPARFALLVAMLCTLSSLLSGCGGVSAATGAGGGAGIQIVAAENFWGSIAAQLAGSRASVQSLIVNPAQDPHSYEPTPADARTLATAQLVIANGLGYDPWIPRLLAANPSSGRSVLSVGSLLGLHAGDNPHRWYSPTDVAAVASAVTAALQKLDPKDRAYFAGRLRQFETAALGPYHALIAAIRARYQGVPVGASESIFALQAPALGLRLLTPYGFMKALSEGTDPTAQDIATTERQIAQRQIKVWIYNSQNATPEVARLNASARARGIPIATITETLSPPPDSFEQWQDAQLRRIEQALHAATVR